MYRLRQYLPLLFLLAAIWVMTFVIDSEYFYQLAKGATLSFVALVLLTIITGDAQCKIIGHIEHNGRCVHCGKRLEDQPTRKDKKGVK